MNNIIAKDFLRTEKSNDEKIKLNEKLWGKQLIVTDIKQEEKAAPHAVKEKDHLIR